MDRLDEFFQSFVKGTIELRSEGLRSSSLKSWVIRPDFYKGIITSIEFDGTYLKILNDSITKGKYLMVDSRLVQFDIRLVSISEEGDLWRIIGYIDTANQDRSYLIYLRRPEKLATKSGTYIEIL